MRMRADSWIWCVLHRRSYFLLCVAIATLVAWRVLHGEWAGDFWEHAAVVDEFATRPLSPRHPMLNVDAAHPLSSPYHLLLGLLSRLTGVSAVDTLALAAVPVFAFFCVALRVFVRLFTRRPIAPFLALLFTLLLWGPGAWEWSGFYHLRSISLVMPYPSTVATAISFLALWTIRAFLLSGRAHWVVAISILGSLTLLTHPPTFFMLCVGSLALFIRYGRRKTAARAVGGLAAFAGAIILATAWPYYPLWDLATADRAGYLVDNDPLLSLSGAALKVFPALLVLPFMVLRTGRIRRDPLAVLFMGVSAGYLVARIGDVASLATSIRFVVLTLHVSAADGLARIVAVPVARRSMAMGVSVAVVVLLILAMTATSLGRSVAGLTRGVTPDLSFLESAVPADAVVMTDLTTALEVPAWGPSVIAWHYAMPFVDDAQARKESVSTYFDRDTAPVRRLEILDHYCAGWILIVPERLDGPTERDARALVADGSVAKRAEDGILLVRRSAPHSCPAASQP